MKIAVISATRVSLSPIEQSAAKCHPEMSIVHIVDEAMSLIAERDGGRVSPINLCRMVRHIESAHYSGIEGVLLSCTIFSPFVDLLSQFSETPLVAADVATFEKAVSSYDKIGVVVTFKPTLNSVNSVLDRCREKFGPVDAEIRYVGGAFEAAARGDDETHNRLVADCVRDLAESCPAVVLSQMSQVRVLPSLTGLAIPVLTTPATSLGVLQDKIRSRRQAGHR